VNFNGTGTVAIRASGNVTSITDNGTGDYTVNFTTAMSDANYAVSGQCWIPTVNHNVWLMSDLTAQTACCSTVIAIFYNVHSLNDDPVMFML
jgi:hypothetical protein